MKIKIYKEHSVCICQTLWFCSMYCSAVHGTGMFLWNGSLHVKWISVSSNNLFKTFH